MFPPLSLIDFLYSLELKKKSVDLSELTRLYKIPLNLTFSGFITGYNIALTAPAVGNVWF